MVSAGWGRNASAVEHHIAFGVVIEVADEARLEVRATAFMLVLRQLAPTGQRGPLLDHGAIEPLARGAHARVRLREANHDKAFAFEFLRRLAEAPRVVHNLLRAVAAGQLAHLLDALQDAFVAVVDLAPDAQVRVDPHDRRRRASLRRMDPARSERGLAGWTLERAGRVGESSRYKL
jgi:hypothetical protein